MVPEVVLIVDSTIFVDSCVIDTKVVDVSIIVLDEPIEEPSVMVDPEVVDIAVAVVDASDDPDEDPPVLVLGDPDT